MGVIKGIVYILAIAMQVGRRKETARSLHLWMKMTTIIAFT